MVSRDYTTLSSYENVKVYATKFDAAIDWDASIMKGVVTYDLETSTDAVVLDTAHLSIGSVSFDGKPLKAQVAAPKDHRGSALTIENVPSGVRGNLVIEFATTSGCTTLQWLKPEQTETNVAPYVFSQGEAIHNRSLYPCFDTPSVKTPFEITIRSAYPVVASGVLVSSANNEYKFEQTVPIPSYLLAIASGNIESRSIGPRSKVWAEPSFVDACQWEFEHDTENFIQVAEKIVFPYEWKTYDVLVLPPSFPFGGMENPNITFATPTLVAGDRQLVDVVAHELAHSWSGNLVTSATWADFWLNEGWTVYLERRIQGQIHGEAFRNFQAVIGWKALEESIEKLPSEFTSLVIDMKEGAVDPDDSFSSVPYEKGSTFLWHLENLLGRDRWDEFIKFYFTKFRYKSLDTAMFVDSLREFFTGENEVAKLNALDWKLWLHAPGLPPKPNFDMSLVEPSNKLADRWFEATELQDASWASKDDIKGWTSLQVVVFLDKLSDLVKSHSYKSPAGLTAVIDVLGNVYGLRSSKNGELISRWFSLAVSARVSSEYKPLAKWLTTVGRMKYARPGYRELATVDRDLAVSTFEANKDFYHPICRSMIAKDLSL